MKKLQGKARSGNQSTKKVLFCPDVHIPYHDKRAWNLFLKTAEGFQPDILVVMGDFGDFWCVSSHSKNPTRELNLDSELKLVNNELDKLDSLGCSQKIFIEGNHEDRMRRYLQDKAPELFGLIGVEKLFKLDDRGWEHISYKESTKLGSLYMTHDIGISTRYAVYRALECFMHSNVTCHTHRLALIVEGDATGKPMVAASFGWLGDTEQVDYMHRVKAKRNWALGFGVGHLDEDGTVFLSPIPIVGYKCCVEGKIYKA